MQGVRCLDVAVLMKKLVHKQANPTRCAAHVVFAYDVQFVHSRLRDIWQESDLKAVIIREMESFLLELGAGFSFLVRQKRIQIDNEDFHLGLLFYNRKLCRLVAVELKIGEFNAAYKGQMEVYLRWLGKHECAPAENLPLGIIFCTGKKCEQIALLALDKSGIHIVEYLTSLPPCVVLGEWLQQVTEQVRLQIE